MNFKQFVNLFKKKKQGKIKINGLVGIIEPTKIALEKNTLDKFNKQITIRERMSGDGDGVFFGKIVEEIPFSPEAVQSLEIVKKIPIVEMNFDDEIYFKKEEDFGGVIN